MTTLATFTEGEPYGCAGGTAVTCEVEFGRDRGLWRAIDELGNVGLSHYKPLAAARCFAARFARESGHPDDPPPPEVDPRCTCERYTSGGVSGRWTCPAHPEHAARMRRMFQLGERP